MNIDSEVLYLALLFIALMTGLLFRAIGSPK